MTSSLSLAVTILGSHQRDKTTSRTSAAPHGRDGTTAGCGRSVANRTCPVPRHRTPPGTRRTRRNRLDLWTRRRSSRWPLPSMVGAPANIHLRQRDYDAAPTEPADYVASLDNDGWSLYGAPWLQPVAGGGKCGPLENRRTEPKPLPWVATGCREKPVVRGASPLRKGGGRLSGSA
jgi:hypothetical protein